MTKRPWVPDYLELSAGQMLLLSEDYSRELQKYGENRSFAAFVYSILSWREKFAHHEKQFNEFLVDGLWNAEKIVSAPEAVESILEPYSFSQKKIRAVNSAAKYFVESNLLDRLRLDRTYQHGAEFRSELVENIFGMGPKFASLSLRMLGYYDLVVVDSNTFKHVESQGFKDRYNRSPPNVKQYGGYEEFIQEESAELSVILNRDISPALWQATIYANTSTWKQDSGFLEMCNLS